VFGHNPSRVYNTPMPDEIKVDAAKFDRILGRMLVAKPLPKAEISERIKAKREAGKGIRERMREKTKQFLSERSKKLGQ
jgi:hypothetical protein